MVNKNHTGKTRDEWMEEEVLTYGIASFALSIIVGICVYTASLGVCLLFNGVKESFGISIISGCIAFALSLVVFCKVAKRVIDRKAEKLRFTGDPMSKSEKLAIAALKAICDGAYQYNHKEYEPSAKVPASLIAAGKRALREIEKEDKANADSVHTAE